MRREVVPATPRKLWPESSLGDHAVEIEHFFRGILEVPKEVLLLESDGGEVVGLVELSIRRAERTIVDRRF